MKQQRKERTSSEQRPIGWLPVVGSSGLVSVGPAGRPNETATAADGARDRRVPGGEGAPRHLAPVRAPNPWFEKRRGFRKFESSPAVVACRLVAPGGARPGRP